MSVETLRDPARARDFFQDKLSFTTGPVDVSHKIKEHPGDITVVDVRAEEDYARGHVPGAINLPEENWDHVENLSRDRVNVIYCYSQTSHLATRAAMEFAEQGFSVMEMEGGFETWKKYSLPVEQ